jgi:hypothetical protein
MFVHLIAAMAMFATLGIEGAAHLHLRRSTDCATALAALNGFGWTQRLGPIGLVTTVLSGIYLAGPGWTGRVPWIGVTYVSLALVAVIGAMTIGRRIPRLRTALSNDDLGGARRQQQAPVLWISFVVRAAILAGVVFLMTMKPGFTESCIAILAAAAGGVVTGLPALRRARHPS